MMALARKRGCGNARCGRGRAACRAALRPPGRCTRSRHLVLCCRPAPPPVLPSGHQAAAARHRLRLHETLRLLVLLAQHHLPAAVTVAAAAAAAATAAAAEPLPVPAPRPARGQHVWPVGCSNRHSLLSAQGHTMAGTSSRHTGASVAGTSSRHTGAGASWTRRHSPPPPVLGLDRPPARCFHRAVCPPAGPTEPPAGRGTGPAGRWPRRPLLPRPPSPRRLVASSQSLLSGGAVTKTERHGPVRELSTGKVRGKRSCTLVGCQEDSERVVDRQRAEGGAPKRTFVLPAHGTVRPPPSCARS